MNAMLFAFVALTVWLSVKFPLLELGMNSYQNFGDGR